VINCRIDRPDRSKQIAEMVSQFEDIHRFVLIGSGTYIFAKSAIQLGLDPALFVVAEGQSTEEIFEHLVESAGDSAMLFGVANIGGPGLDLVRFFKNRSRRVQMPAVAA